MFKKFEKEFKFSGWFAKGGFKSNFLFTSSNKLFAILLTFIFTPVFSRVYDPAAYGYFSILNILITHFSLISTLGYSEAILICREEGEALKLSQISLIFILLLSGLFTIIFPFLIGVVSDNNDLNSLGIGAFIVIPIVMSLIGLFNKWSQFYNQFRFATIQNSLVNVVIRILGLTIGLFGKSNLYGLVLAEGVGRGLSLMAFCVNYKSKALGLLKPLKKSDLVHLLAKYKSFPMFLIPSRYLGIIITQIPLIYVASNFSTDLLGQLSMAMSLITYPLGLLGNAMAPVFIRRVRDVGHDELKYFMGKLNLWLTILALGPVLISMVLAKDGLQFFLGANWEIAGALSGILLVTLIHDILNVIFGGIFQLMGLQRRMLHLNLIFIVVYGIFYYFLQAHSKELIFVIMGFSILRLVAGCTRNSYLFVKLGMFRAMWINVGSAILLIVFLLKFFR